MGGEHHTFPSQDIWLETWLCLLGSLFKGLGSFLQALKEHTHGVKQGPGRGGLRSE